MTATVHNERLRRHFDSQADQRARDNEGYREVPESDHLDILRVFERRAPGKGLVYGTVFGLLIWAAIGLVVWRVVMG